MSVDQDVIDETIAVALREDLGDLGLAGDLTSAAVVPVGSTCRAQVVARAPGVVSGGEVARRVFLAVDGSLSVEVLREDGRPVVPGDAVLTVSGGARSVLAAERTALNFLQHLSGVATLARSYVDTLARGGSRALVKDTRKTTPGLRALEKAAVRAGGGSNHRAGLFGAVLVKDNHLAIAGSVATVIHAARRGAGPKAQVEVEVETIEQVREACAAGADVIMLDNMGRDAIIRAVGEIAGRAIVEVSGGVSIGNVVELAIPGVDWISVGAITQSAPAVDFSLEVIPD